MSRNALRDIEEDLTIFPGTGATKSVGSDAYPYYVSEVLPNGVIGMYDAPASFDDKHPWEGGTQVVKPFDPAHKSEFYLKRRYGKWWEVTREGKPIRQFTGKYVSLSFGHAYAYQNPSF